MAQKDLTFVVYVSSAVRLLSDEELKELLRLSRINNARLGVTGMLLYDRGNFIQMLEGPGVNVDALYERIRADPRHTRITTLLQGPLEKRQFETLAMGFDNCADLSVDDRAAGLRDFAAYLHPPATRDAPASQASCMTISARCSRRSSCNRRRREIGSTSCISALAVQFSNVRQCGNDDQPD